VATLQILPARPADAETVHRAMQSGFREYDGVLDPPTGSLGETVDDVRRGIEAGGAVVARLDGAVVGCARFELGGDEMYVGRVTVLPEFRRRGIAAAMMSALEREAKEAGVSIVRVGVRMSLPENVSLYRRLGYQLVDIAPHPKGPDMVGTLVKRLR
jgi:ribosomal protein S18 acetylase RimI-like enzyme